MTTREPQRAGETRRRVLLAEDDDDMRRLLARGLAADGFEVIEAGTGAELIDKLGVLLLDPTDVRALHLIVSDINMPWANGLAVLARLRGLGCAVPVILITAFGDEATHLEAKRLGAAAVFDKPFELHELRSSALRFAGF